MDTYIGIDAHARSCTVMAVGPSGRKLSEHIVQTNAAALIDCIRAIARPRHLCLEEGNLSAWLYETLKPHVDELVVEAFTTRKQGPKSDARDALARAQDLRTGAIEKRVFKDPCRFALLRELARTYEMITRDVVRTQCRLKALYLHHGIHAHDRAVYSPDHRDEWMSKLPSSCHSSAKLLYAEFDAARQLKLDASEQLITESHRHPISKVLETCPGFGPIRTALMVPIVVTPHRFRTARQFWSYCGLGILMRSSSDWVRDGDRWVRAQVNKTRGLNHSFNHTLKNVFKSAAMTIVTNCPDHPLRQHYNRMLTNGTKPNLAKVTLARKIAATALVMWKKEEVYDPARHRNP